ncbi:hypothetical protein ABW21_db0202121 [Orbilia brochopaga]|nr:hypothetical protein ABW21_db0202121 [Drechslerella brochopaga]
MYRENVRQHLRLAMIVLLHRVEKEHIGHGSHLVELAERRRLQNLVQRRLERVHANPARIERRQTRRCRRHSVFGLAPVLGIDGFDEGLDVSMAPSDSGARKFGIQSGFVSRDRIFEWAVRCRDARFREQEVMSKQYRKQGRQLVYIPRQKRQLGMSMLCQPGCTGGYLTPCVQALGFLSFRRPPSRCSET